MHTGDPSHLLVTVVGAGPVGICAGLIFARCGYQVRILERRGDPRLAADEGRSINLTLGRRAIHAFEELGLWSAVREQCVPLYARMIHHEDGTTSRQPYGPFGECLYAIRRLDLAVTLVKIASDHPAISLHFDSRVTNINSALDSVCIQSPDLGNDWQPTDLLVAADGTSSTLRNYMLARGRLDIEQSFVRHVYKEITFPPEAGTEALAVDSLHIWPRKDGFLAVFPNIDSSFTGILFLPFHETGMSFRSITSPNEFRRFFSQHFSDIAPLANANAAEFFSRPLGTITTIRCTPWSWDGRMILIGDAAHTMAPFLGQGVNAGLEDCRILGELLAEHRRDLGQVLEQFEKLRKPETDAVTELAESHYRELAIEVNNPDFLNRKRIENDLYRQFPDTFAPPYVLVAFTDVPYSRVLSIAEWQQTIVSRLAKIHGSSEDIEPTR